MYMTRPDTEAGTRLIRAERTETEGITVDYALSRGANGYSLQAESEGRSETLSDYTANGLLAQAFYLLVREGRVLPGTLRDLWHDFCSAELPLFAE